MALTKALFFSASLALSLVARADEPWMSIATKAMPTHALHSASNFMSKPLTEQTLRVTVGLKLRNSAELNQFLADLRAGKSAPLTNAEFVERFSPSAAQLQQVIDYLKASGLTNITASPNRTLIAAQATPSTIRKAFNTTLVQIDAAGHYANQSDAQVPASLSDIVLSVQGLQNAERFHTAYRLPNRQDAKLAASGITPIEPMRLQKIYDAQDLPQARHVTIGIIAEGNMDLAQQSLSEYEQYAHLQHVPVKIENQYPDGPPPLDFDNAIEWSLDGEAALATAGGSLAGINFYTANTMYTGDILLVMNQAVTADEVKVINISLAGCETSFQKTGLEQQEDQVLQQAVAQGQLFVAASGDYGSNQCYFTDTPGRSYPAVSPYVVAVGGTTLTTNHGQTQRRLETAWWGTHNSIGETEGTGGGPSITEPVPEWQKDVALVVQANGRGTPDVAFDADPASGALIYYPDPDTGAQVHGAVGGTSLSAPILTGFWARLLETYPNFTQQYTPGSAIFYTMPSIVFNDVTIGSNGDYNAGPGWDFTTGWGSIDIGKFAMQLGLPPVKQVNAGTLATPATY